MRFIRSAVVISILVGIITSPALCGKIIGSVRNLDTKGPLRDVSVRVYPAGRSLGQSTSADRDGKFEVANLPAGLYAVCVGAQENSRPRVTSVVVPEEGEVEVHFGLAPSIAVDGDSWLQGYPVFYQSFTATGLGVTSLRLKAFGPGRAVKVQMLEGDGMSGKPIGPSRTTVEFGGEGETAVFWSGGELPTIPGRRYTFKLSAEEGMTWVPGVAGRGDVYPLGQAYFGSESRPLSDLGFAICEENDNLATSYAVAPGRRAILVRAVGQSFVARSRNILFAAASIAPAIPQAAYVRFSIHEGGPGGRQIGPSKGTSVGMDASVAWLPGEVDVVPGERYYLHIESYDGIRFYAYEELDPYAKGGAFNDAVLDRKYDLAAWIAGELSESDQAALFRHPQSVETVALVNPSFEEDMKGWTLTKPFGKVIQCDAGILPAWGMGMFGWTNRGEGQDSRTVVYQIVDVKKGKRYSFSGSVYTDRIGGRSSDQKVRLVVNPTGKPEFTNETMDSSQWYATEGQWRRGSVEFIAQSDKIAIGFELEQRWSLESCSLYVDGAHLEQIAGI